MRENANNLYYPHMNNLRIILIPLLALSFIPAAHSQRPAYGTGANPAGSIKILREFAPVKEFGVRIANEVEFDPAYFTFRTVSARALIGHPRTTALEVKTRYPGAVAVMNASFFSLTDGSIIGEFVENGKRPPGLIYGGKDIDRLLVSRKDGAADILSGKTRLSDEEMENTLFAVSGKSRWPGQADATSRSAVCVKYSGRFLLAAVYPVSTVKEMTEYMVSEGCVPEKIIHFDGGGSTQMAYAAKGGEWMLGWERKGENLPECHLKKDNRDARCYRPVASFVIVVPS